jgi:bacterial/archaeal transporter family-2 protein
MNNLLLVLLMACGGVAVAMQPSINARLARNIGNLESSLISFAVGTLALLVAVMIFGRGSLRGVGGASWWELTGGFLGAYFVTMTIIAVPRLGTAAVMAIAITGQLVSGAMLDHYGLFGLRQIPLTALRGIGILLLCLGASLVIRR